MFEIIILAKEMLLIIIIYFYLFSSFSPGLDAVDSQLPSIGENDKGKGVFLYKNSIRVHVSKN